MHRIGGTNSACRLNTKGPSSRLRLLQVLDPCDDRCIHQLEINRFGEGRIESDSTRGVK